MVYNVVLATMAVGYIREKYCIVHDDICKKGAPLPVNCLPCVKLCVEIPEDGMSIACNRKGIE